MTGSLVLFFVLLITGLAVCDGIFWLRVIRKQSNGYSQQLFVAITLLIGIEGIGLTESLPYGHPQGSLTDMF